VRESLGPRGARRHQRQLGHALLALRVVEHELDAAALTRRTRATSQASRSWLSELDGAARVVRALKQLAPDRL